MGHGRGFVRERWHAVYLDGFAATLDRRGKIHLTRTPIKPNVEYGNSTLQTCTICRTGASRLVKSANSSRIATKPKNEGGSLGARWRKGHQQFLVLTCCSRISHGRCERFRIHFTATNPPVQRSRTCTTSMQGTQEFSSVPSRFAR